MKFDSVTIKNFRNFEDITISLTNKNVLFGILIKLKTKTII